MSNQELDLTKLIDGHPGISRARGLSHIEAAIVCLEKNGHSSGVSFELETDSQKAYSIRWPTSTDFRRHRAWADLPEATEEGAACLAALIAKKETGLSVVKRSRKGTGFDYWLGMGEEQFMFQELARLEVSGIISGDVQVIRRRLRAKISQTQRSDGLGIRAFVIIVEFGAPRGVMHERS